MNDEIERLLKKTLYKKSFYDFVKDFWNLADPSKFIDGDLIQFYCEVFQYMCRNWVGYTSVDIVIPEKTSDIEIIDVRQNKNNININVPPRHSKSTIFNVMGPVWLWLNYPAKAVSVSHINDLATQMNSKRYAIINSEKFKKYFPEIDLVKNSTTFLKDGRGGELYSLSRNAFTGFGGDVIINDDLTNAETARKDKEEMENAWSYFRNTMPSRINDVKKCIIMNIQQRLAPNDITGHILNNKDLRKTYIFVTLPAQFRKTTYLICPISGKIIKFNKGDYLWPERFGDYQQLRYQVGETIFETQYMQNPIATDKTIIKENLIIEKDKIDCPLLEDADMIYASHDFPVKDKETSDNLGSVLAYKAGATLYIKDCLEKKMAFVKSVDYVKQLDSFYPGIIQIIEDKANGSPILQQLQDIVAGMQAYNPGSASKTQRLESASLYMSSQNVIFVKDKFDKLTQTYQLSESLSNLKNRLLNFPFVAHDDIVDAFSMLVLFVFMDRRYMVYGRSFNDENIINTDIIKNITNKTIFFNKEGDKFKVLECGIKYGVISELYILRETFFKADIKEAFEKLKEFAPTKKVFIDCSATEAMIGMSTKNIIIERYSIEDFDKSVTQLNLAFSKKLVKINTNCKLTKSDIESFKFTKNKDDTVKYASEKDGFIACIRVALKYFGGII